MRGFKIGRILGFEISVDASWLVILALVVWSFSTAVFPDAAPDLDPRTYWLMGLVGAVVFFASLLAHELGHSVVARAKGIPVHGITLFIFGGISRMRAEAESPGDELVIAGIGPLVSLVAAALFWLVTAAGSAAGWSPAVVEVTRVLFVLNLALAAFNLLPGFPLDGGRLFRATVWKATGDLDRATRIATGSGQLMGFLLIGLGLWSLFAGNTLGGIWIAFIGWYLQNTAEMSYRQHVLQAGLEGARVREAMAPEPEVVDAGTLLDALVEERFLHHDVSAYAVLDGEVPVGIVTLSQVRDVPREEWPRTRVRDVMVPAEEKELTVGPDDTLTEAVRRLQPAPVDRLLVVEGGHLVGTLSAENLTSWIALARPLREDERVEL